MSKRIVLGLIVIGIVAAGAPPALGLIYEDRIRESLAGTTGHPALDVELVQYQRGLYASTAVVRFGFSDAYVEKIRELAAADPNDTAVDPGSRLAATWLVDLTDVELRFNVDVNHGPLAATDGLGLALATFRAELDASEGTLAELREAVDTPWLYRTDGAWGFDNRVDFRSVVPAMDWQNDEGTRVSFSGFDSHGTYDVGTETVALNGAAESLDVLFEGGSIRATGLAIEIGLDRFRQYLWTGEQTVRLASLEARADASEGDGTTTPASDATAHSEPESFRMDQLAFRFTADLNETRDKISIGMVYELGALEGIPDSALSDLRFGFLLRDLDADAVEWYTALNQRMLLAGPGDIEALMPELQRQAMRLVKGNPGLSLDPVEFTLNDQSFEGRIQFDFDGSALPADLDFEVLAANPLFLIGGLSAEGRVHTSDPLFRLMAAKAMAGQIQASLPQGETADEAQITAIATQQSSMLIDGLLMQGLIQSDDGMLSSDFSFDNGVLIVNGQPVPLGG